MVSYHYPLGIELKREREVLIKAKASTVYLKFYFSGYTHWIKNGRKRRNVSRKQKLKDAQSQDANTTVTDTYTAELPGNVIYEILSLISTKHAVRASILLKEWGRLWSSVPVLDFDEGEGGQPCGDKLQRRKFMNFMGRCLKRRGKDQSDIDKFRLRMRYYGGLTSVNNWLSLAVERNVKEIEISFIREKGIGGRSYRPFYIPQSILNNAKSLTTLKLQRVTVKDSIDPISLPSLKTMSLKQVDFRSNLLLTNLVTECPSLEHLLLTSCTGISNLKVLSLSLKSLEVANCDVRGITVEAVNLESLKSQMYRLYTLDIFSCQRVRCIECCDMFLTSEWCKGFNSSFPLLESLALHQCHWNYLEQMEIYSQNLKRFAFSNLRPTTPFFSLKLPNLLEARLDFLYKPVSAGNYSQWDFSWLRNCLEYFNCSRELTLHFALPQLCTFPEEIRKSCPPPLPSLKHLEVEIGTPTTDAATHSAMMDSLHWMAPVSQVSIYV